MRKFSLFLLLASTAVPALAQDSSNERAERRAERRAAAAEESDSRPQRRVRSEQSEQLELRQPRVQRSEGSETERPDAGDRFRDQIRERREQRQQAASAETDSAAPVRNWRRRDEAGAGETGSGWQPRERRIRTIPDTQPTARPATIEPPANVVRHRRDYRDGNYTRWSRNWHRDNRYDWRRWRDRHRSRFHLGFYYDPFGWSYRRWSFGSFLWPSYYSSRYWLHDPWSYRLPPAYGPYRWVRYWDDALLVNIYTGQVVDVIHNFFW